MSKSLGVLVIVILSLSLLGSAYAHKSQIIDNYKFEVGWEKEPPITGKLNSVIITVSKTSTTDKKMAKEGNIKQKSNDQSYKETKQGIKKYKTSSQDIAPNARDVGVPGLADVLEADIQLNGQKTFLKLIEDKNKQGAYYGNYTPQKEGYPIVHIYGKIDKKEYEITFHPEKIVSGFN